MSRDALNEILDNLRYEATQARLLGVRGDRLADALENLIAQYSGTTAAYPEPTRAAGPAPDPAGIGRRAGPELDGENDGRQETPVGLVPDDTMPDRVSPDENNPDEFVTGVLAELDQDLRRRATPQDIILHVRRNDGNELSLAAATAAVTLILPSIIDVTGELAVDDSHTDDDNTSIVHVRLVAGGETDLHQLGTGRDGFNAVVPVPGAGEITITSRVGDAQDRDLADELGLTPVDLPAVPDGQHPINGVLEVIETVTGVRPRGKGEFTVRYSKNDGRELTTAQVHTIINHPVSQHGLRRIGETMLLTVDDGEHSSVKIAQFGLISAGEIDLAVLAIRAAQYRGTFDFGAPIGSVTANGEASLADVDA